jgi:uncharacterized membrane protein YoaK (UPF0700 family)
MNEAPAPPPAATNPHLIYLLLLLSLTTGLIDAITVLGLGRVFTANMTGNVVFLGFAAAGAPGFVVLPYVAAIATFLAGAAAAGLFRQLYRENEPGSWLLHASVLEASLLWLAAAVATSFDIEAQQPAAALFAIIALTGFAMGFRNGIIRQLKVPDLTTTVLTLTLTGLAADATLGGGANANWRRRIGSVAAIFVGAVLGALLVLGFGLVGPLILAGALGLVGTSACSLFSHAGRTSRRPPVAEV